MDRSDLEIVLKSYKSVSLGTRALNIVFNILTALYGIFSDKAGAWHRAGNMNMYNRYNYLRVHTGRAVRRIRPKLTSQVIRHIKNDSKYGT